MSKYSCVFLACVLLIPLNSASAQTRSSEAFGSGVHQYFNGRHQEAIHSLNIAIAKDSKNARAYYFRGLAKMGSGDSFGAESDFELGAAVESSSSRRPTSVVTRSLERVQGSMRLKLENTRRRVFDGSLKIESTAIASSIPVQSLPLPTSGLVIYDAPVLPSPPIVNSSIISAPIVSAPIISAPINYPQPIFQPQTVVHSGFECVPQSNVIQGFANPVVDSYPSPIVFTGPAPVASVFAESEQSAISVETPVEEVGVVGDEAMAAKPTLEPTEEAVAAAAAAALTEADIAPEPADEGVFGASIEADLEVKEDMTAAKEEADQFPTEDAGEQFPAENTFGSEGDVPSETANGGSFGGAFSSELAETPKKAMAAEEEAVEQSQQSPGAAQEEIDAFVGDNVFGGGVGDSAAANEDPFGAAASVEPDSSKAGSDPLGADDSEASENSFGVGSAAKDAEDPFGAGGAPEDSEEPFGDSAPEEFTDDPFGS